MPPPLMLDAPTLDAIGLKHQTDKSSIYHSYLEFYELFFAPLRERRLKVLEIGVLNGASLRTWEEYFRHSDIIGVDIAPAAKFHQCGRVTIELADQSNLEEMVAIAVRHGPFDIIIEDGSHMWNHQLTSLRTLFPFVRNDGIYIVEDLHTNYGAMQAGFQGVATAPTMALLKQWLDLRVADDQLPIEAVEDAFLRTYGRAVQFMTFYKRACLIKKRVPPAARDHAGRPLVARSADVVPVPVLAHVSALGDVAGAAGFINPGPDGAALQGLAIHAPDVLEYRVRDPDGGWSGWSRDGVFAGTRGQGRLLSGYAVRLLGAARPRLGLRVFARFAGSAAPIEVADGEDCISRDGGPLCALQIDLTQRFV